jgi:hypothetical protein
MRKIFNSFSIQISVACIAAAILILSLQPAIAKDKNFDRILGWFPADIETLCVIRGPFRVPTPYNPEPTTSPTLKEALERSILVPFGSVLPDKDMYSLFEGRVVLLAMEGSRDFVFPGNVAANKYSGVHVCMFQEPVSDRFLKFLRQHAWSREEHIWSEGKKNASNDLCMAVAGENVILLSTDRDMLRDTLGRMNRNTKPQAMSPSLPEWQFLNQNCRFWAIRHFQKDTKDTGSPLYRSADADDKATGVVFEYDPEPTKEARIVYISSSPSATEYLKGRVDLGDKAKNYSLKAHKISNQAVAMTVPTKTAEERAYLILSIDGLLGHAVNP